MTHQVALKQENIFENLYIKGFIDEGEYQAGLRFKWLNRKIRSLISSPQLSQAQLEDPHLRTSFAVDESYAQAIEKEWRNAWLTVNSAGKK